MEHKFLNLEWTSCSINKKKHRILVAEVNSARCQIQEIQKIDFQDLKALTFQKLDYFLRCPFESIITSDKNRTSFAWVTRTTISRTSKQQNFEIACITPVFQFRFRKRTQKPLRGFQDILIHIAVIWTQNFLDKLSYTGPSDFLTSSIVKWTKMVHQFF